MNDEQNTIEANAVGNHPVGDCPAAPAPLAPTPGSAIFVVVLVTYDYYRFQDNLGAATDIETARAIATKAAMREPEPCPVIEDAEKSHNSDSGEDRHIWIESFPQNT